ncbi:MAG: HAD hydrolase-like protein [Actinomycetota bacterium]|nr:HAD hydrolase-like protein [Actinomycetota bacterium]
MASILVLWDVDYTLVDANGAGRRLYQLAFADLYGTELPAAAEQANMAGRTDRAIAIDVLALAGIPDPRAEVSRFEAALTRLAPEVAHLVADHGTALPGAREALAALAATTGPMTAGPMTTGPMITGPAATTGPAAAGGLAARQSVLTGNIRALAEAKLAPLGLTCYLDLEIGAYGNEHEIRSELVHLARARAAAADGTDFGGRATVLIGDTPLDVAAALATGARAIGVATGMFTAGQLAEAGADVVLPDLTDTGRLLAALAGD